jgi:hypothetical protein
MCQGFRINAKINQIYTIFLRVNYLFINCLIVYIFLITKKGGCPPFLMYQHTLLLKVKIKFIFLINL